MKDNKKVIILSKESRGSIIKTQEKYVIIENKRY